VCLAAAIGATQPTFLTEHLSFEPNVGQTESSALFMTRGPGYVVQLGAGKVTFKVGDKAVQMDLLHARGGALRGESLLPGKVSYFPGPDRSRWHSNIPTYERVVERGVYPGVDVDFHGNLNRFEYDFVVQPNGSANQIRLKFSGAEGTSVNSDGDLLLSLGQREIRLLRPVAYQMAGDGVTKEAVRADYRLNSRTGLVGFEVGDYDHARPLVIDPVLHYSEYLNNTVNASTTDAAGNIYLVSGGGFGEEASVTKRSASGTVVYTTFFGTNVTPLSVAVDATGKADIGGQAFNGSTLPVGSNGYSSAQPENSSAFFLQLSASGSSVVYATYLGGSTDYSNNSASAIALDPSGNAYLAGSTTSLSFPTTSGAYQTVNPSNITTGFVAKFNPSLSGKASLVYSTLIGPPSDAISDGSFLNGIAVDSSGDAYVTCSSPTGYPVTNGAFQYTGYASNFGVYVTKFNAAGSALVYSAYLGNGVGYGIAVDALGDAFVTGTVGYSDFPVTPGAYQTTYPGGFVTELNETGSAEVFSTFLGGPSSVASEENNVAPSSIALTPGCPATSPTVINCEVYIAGTTSTTDFPSINGLQTAPASQLSAFVVELAAGGASAIMSTYLGGVSAISTSYLPLIGVDSAGNITLTGNLISNSGETSFPVTVPAPANVYPAFLAKIAPNAVGEVLGSSTALSFNNPVGVSSSVLGSTATVTLTNFGSSAASISSIQGSPTTFSQSNNCGTSLPAAGSCAVTVNFTPATAATVSGAITVTSNASNSPLKISLSGTGSNSSYLQASASSITFASQNVDTTSKSQTIVLSNIGNTVSAPAISISPADFAQSTNCASQLAAHSTCNIAVSFTPSQVGLREGTLSIFDSASNRSFYLLIDGTGTSPGSTPSVTIAPQPVEFNPTVVSGSSATQYISITNTSAEPITVQSVAAAGDFSVTNTYCLTPAQLQPTTSCQVGVIFSPTAVGSRTGTLTVVDSVSATPQSASLTGTGLASSEKVEIYPATTVVAPNQAVGSTGPDQIITFENTGTAPIAIYRVTTTGNFQINGDSCSSNTVAGTSDDGGGSYASCQVSVDFVPLKTGLLTGTLVFYDSAPGSPHVVNLSGTGITATGTLVLSDTSFNFPAMAVGTSGASVAEGVQDVYLYNPGDSPVQITSISITGDYQESSEFCGAPPFTLNPGENSCNLSLTFGPTAVGTRAGTLTVHSSAGNQTAALTGTGTAGTKGVQLIPGSSMNFGPVVVGQTGNSQTVYAYIDGADPVTFTLYTQSGTNSGDFSLTGSACTGTYTSGQICSLYYQFTPTGAGTRTATVTLTDSAGSQSVTLTGTGVTSAPAGTIYPTYLNFEPQTQGTINFGNLVTFTNNSLASVSLGNATVTGNFISSHGNDTCSGSTLAAGQSCYLWIEYAPPVANPPANRLDTGVLTVKNSTGTTLASVPMSGYSLEPTYSAQLSQNVVNFSQQQALEITSVNPAYVQLLNTGSAPLTVGAVSGTNLGLAGPSAEFSILGANGGADYCSNTTVAGGSSCYVLVTFTPNVLGASTGTLNFPVTYANNSKATLTAKLNATGVAVQDGAYLSPASLTFPDLGVGTRSQYGEVNLNNTSNEPLKVGTLTGVNTIVGTSTTGEFSANDGCSNAVVVPGGSCLVNVTLTPSAAGKRTGSISFPVTYQDQHTATLVLPMAGNALSATKLLQIDPLSVAFTPEVQNDPSLDIYEYVLVTNSGNAPVTIGVDSISTNPADFQIVSDPCASSVLAAGASCNITLRFNPAATSTGTRTGVLTIADNAAGGPHKVALSGKALTASQQMELSQTAVNFGTVAAGSESATQVIYLTDQGPQQIDVESVVLGGADAADFQMSTYCQGYLNGSCTISVTFAPQPGVTGTRTATITETDSAPGSPRVITLTGVAN
jgi:hypothetical protein